MRITRFWAKGYRSLRDVELAPLGPFVVFYGPNGSGKSNVIAAIDAFFKLLAIGLRTGPFEAAQATDGSLAMAFQIPKRAAGEKAKSVLSTHDFYSQTPTHTVVLGAHLSFEPGERTELQESAGLDGVLDAEVTCTRLGTEMTLEVTRLFGRDGAREIRGEPFLRIKEWCCNELAPSTFGIIDSIRALPEEQEPTSYDESIADPIVDEMRRGHIKTALFNAKNSIDGQVQARYEELQQFMTRTLMRPPFQVTRDPKTRVLEIYESLSGPNRERVIIPIKRAGLGVVQLYAIVATLILSRWRMVALEEPEAHLHARSTGLELRRALQHMVEPGDGSAGKLDQLFVATHSNLFDLDEDGFWDVSMENGETRIIRKPLDQIDAEHLYEPGPAKHILMRLLELYGDELVFRTGDGRRMTASEMLDALRRDDDVAVEFLRTLHGAALDTMAMRARRGPRPEAAQ